MNSVKYNLKNANSNKDTLIFLIFRLDDQKLKVSTKLKINPRYWNFEHQRVKKSYKNSKLINDLLDAFDVKLNRLLLERKLTGAKCSVDDLKYELFGQSKKIERNSSLFGYFRAYISNKQLVWSRSTFNSYNRTLEILTEFMNTTGIKDDFDVVDMKFYNSLLNFLYSEPRNYSINNAGKVIQNLKAVLNSAVSDGICTNIAFKNKNFKKLAQVTSHIYLSLDELAALQEMQYNNQKYTQVRDVLIVLCFTGLRFSDVFTLKKSSIRTVSDSTSTIKILEVLTKKTGALVFIPLHPLVEKI